MTIVSSIDSVEVIEPVEITSTGLYRELLKLINFKLLLDSSAELVEVHFQNIQMSHRALFEKMREQF